MSAFRNRWQSSLFPLEEAEALTKVYVINVWLFQLKQASYIWFIIYYTLAAVLVSIKL